MSGVEELREVMALLAKAEPGEWKAYGDGNAYHNWSAVIANGPVIAECSGADTDAADAANAAAIAAAVNWLRTHAPALLERIAALEADAARVAAMRRNLTGWEVALEMGIPDFGHDGMAATWAKGYDACLRHAIEDTRAALDAARVGG